MKNYISLDEHKNNILSNPSVKKEYEALESEYALIQSLIEKRLKRKMSQQDLAKKIGSRQSVISRLESGNANPSIKFLNRIATALNARLTISIQ